MEINIISIGNSKGLRIPKNVLKECAILDKVNLQIKNNKIILTPIKKPKKNIRKNWNKYFKNMHLCNDDLLFIDDSLDTNLDI